jgi:hypothetical protein
MYINMVKSPAKKSPVPPDVSGGVNSAKSSIIPEGNYCLQAQATAVVRL